MNVGKLLRLCILKSELKNEWAPSQTFFFGISVLQQFCHRAKVASALLSVVKNSWNGHFSDFINLQEKNQVLQNVSNISKFAGFLPCNFM